MSNEELKIDKETFLKILKLSLEKIKEGQEYLEGLNKYILLDDYNNDVYCNEYWETTGIPTGNFRIVNDIPSNYNFCCLEQYLDYLKILIYDRYEYFDLDFKFNEIKNECIDIYNNMGFEGEI